MLIKNNRLTKDREFENVFAKGSSNFDQLMGIKVAKNNLATYRVGILVGTKINKKAVIRNLIKRRIRAAVKNVLAESQINRDIVIISRPPIVNADFKAIEASVFKHFKKLRII